MMGCKSQTTARHQYLYIIRVCKFKRSKMTPVQYSTVEKVSVWDLRFIVWCDEDSKSTGVWNCVRVNILNNSQDYCVCAQSYAHITFVTKIFMKLDVQYFYWDCSKKIVTSTLHSMRKAPTQTVQMNLYRQFLKQKMNTTH